jgi:hypothetical protein
MQAAASIAGITTCLLRMLTLSLAGRTEQQATVVPNWDLQTAARPHHVGAGRARACRRRRRRWTSRSLTPAAAAAAAAGFAPVSLSLQRRNRIAWREAEPPPLNNPKLPLFTAPAPPGGLQQSAAQRGKDPDATGHRGGPARARAAQCRAASVFNERPTALHCAARQGGAARCRLGRLGLCSMGST